MQYNTFGLANDNPLGRPKESLVIAGDTRSNVQPGLIALHSLFVREHNRQCDIYKAKHPDVSIDKLSMKVRHLTLVLFLRQEIK